MVQTHNSRLHVAFGGVGTSLLNGDAALTITNDGSSVGTFNAAMLRVNWKADKRDLSFDVALGNGETVPVSAARAVTIRAGIGLHIRLNGPTSSAQAVALLTPKVSGDYTTAPIAQAICLIRADTTDAYGRPAIQVLPVACLPFAPWLAHSVLHQME
jgi:hypothetical protein